LLAGLAADFRISGTFILAQHRPIPEIRKPVIWACGGGAPALRNCRLVI